VSTYYTEELQQEIRRSFSLFDFFEHNQAFSGFIDIITNESNLGGTAMSALFLEELHTQINYVLEQHTLHLVPETTIPEKNEFMWALAQLQRLEDYTGVIRTLENMAPNEEQFAAIIADLSMLNESQVHALVKDFNPRILQTLKDFIYAKETAVVEEPNAKLIANLRMFHQVFGNNNLGYHLVKGEVRLNERFETYLSYVKDEFIDDVDEQCALNILSVIYLSNDGFNSPITVYRKYSHHLLNNLDRVSRVEVQVLNMIGRMNEFKQATDEKNRLSSTVIEA
jgi:hypothetical protein